MTTLDPRLEKRISKFISMVLRHRPGLIGLTPDGLDLIDKAVAAHVRRQSDLVSTLTQEERTDIDTALRTFLEKIDIDDFPE